MIVGGPLELNEKSPLTSETYEETTIIPNVSSIYPWSTVTSSFSFQFKSKDMQVHTRERESVYGTLVWKKC